jgi:parvulin-like peptidyl-prolyl isomerase
MSKKNTSGIPSQRSVQPTTPETVAPLQKINPLREAHTRMEKEAIIQRLVLIGVAIAGGLAAIIVVGALLYDQAIVPGQAVAAVNGDTITVSEFEQRVRLERAFINNRLNDIIRQSAEFGDQGEQFLQFQFGQEPYASWWNEIQVSDQLGNRVLNDMIADEIVRAEAAERGITVTDEQVQEKINAFFGYDPEAILAATQPEATAEATEETTPTPTPFVSPTPSPEPSPTAPPTPTHVPTEDPDAAPTATSFPTLTPFPTTDPTQAAIDFQTEVDSTFNEVASTAGVSREFILEYFRMQALRDALAEAALEDFEATEQFVNIRHILVETEEEAQDILAALEAGESFAELARAASTDTGSAENGGVYDWAPASQYVEPFANAVGDGEIGAFLGPVATEFGFHVIQVIGRRDEPMPEEQIEFERAEALDTYLEELRTSENYTVETFPIWVDNVPNEPVFIPVSA